MLGKQKWGNRNLRRKTSIVKYILLILMTIMILPIGTIIYYSSNNHKNMDIIMNSKTKINVYNTQTKELMKIPLEQYIVGVVAAEMPADFELEALKAQAVAARTYSVKRLQSKDPKVAKYHPAANITTDPSINQAWISEDQMKKNWGNISFQKKYYKIIKVVAETEGEIILYDNKLIDPLFFSSSGGKKTENSEDVFINKIPYLRSVESPERENKHTATLTPITFSTIDTKLGVNLETIPATKLSTSTIIKVLEKTEGDRIKTININGKTFTGREIREKLGLKSTDISYEIKDQCIIFITNGYGHGVGLSQYGADEFARKGKNYQQILTHYYTGVKIGRLKEI